MVHVHHVCMPLKSICNRFSLLIVSSFYINKGWKFVINIWYTLFYISNQCEESCFSSFAFGMLWLNTEPRSKHHLKDNEQSVIVPMHFGIKLEKYQRNKWNNRSMFSGRAPLIYQIISFYFSNNILKIFLLFPK